MRKLTSTFLVIFTAIAGFPPLTAQQLRLSPHETISAPVDDHRDGIRVTIVYGRPLSRDQKSGELRRPWGTLVPYGKVWRMGADEATLFITQKPILLGGATIPAGAYTLWFLLDPAGTGKLIVNKQIGQWGLHYEEKQDLARIDMKKDSLDQRLDQFTMAVEMNPSNGGGVLKLMWESAQFSVPFTFVK
jgi:hypothetical protein